MAWPEAKSMFILYHVKELGRSERPQDSENVPCLAEPKEDGFHQGCKIGLDRPV
jgi:hypothetical protein